MKNIFLILLIYSINSSASMSCFLDEVPDESDYINSLLGNDSIEKLHQQVLQSIDPLKIKYDYKLAQDCSYTYDTSFTITNDQPIEDFMQEIFLPSNNVKSADKKTMTGYKIDGVSKDNKASIDDRFTREVLGSKIGMKVAVSSDCVKTKSESDLVEYNCKLKPKETTLKFLFSTFYPFESNESIVTCKKQSEETKSCSFKTNGKLMKMGPLKPCYLASEGAGGIFEAVYRLAHYLHYRSSTSPGFNKSIKDLKSFSKSLKSDKGSKATYSAP